MTHEDSHPSLYGPMPELGTMKICDFCHMVVTLKEAPSGWRYWCADRDPVDGGRYCHGGQPSRNPAMPPLWTLHVPAPRYEAARAVEKWFYRYTPEGEGRFA